MNIVVEILLLVLLFLIVFQDIKYRAISWVVLPVIVFLFAYRQGSMLGVNVLLSNTGINFSFVVLQYGLLSLYFSIKNKHLVNIIDQYIGLGDVLFFVVLCFAFSPVNYIAFYFGTTIFTLIAVLAYNVFSKKSSAQIPLAGIQSAWMAVLLMFNSLWRTVPFYNDLTILSYWI